MWLSAGRVLSVRIATKGTPPGGAPLTRCAPSGRVMDGPECCLEAGSMMYQVVNPATGKVESEYPTATDAEVSDGLGRAKRAYTSWVRPPIEQPPATCPRAPH